MIEFGAKLTLKDGMYATLQKNIKLQKEFSKQVKDTSKSIQDLGKRKANPIVRIRDNATGQLMGIKREIRAMSDVKALTKAEVDDQATRKVDAIKQKLKNLGKTIVSPFIRLKENVSSKADKIKQKLKQISTTFTPIVKIRDLASQGLSKIKNTLGGMKRGVTALYVTLKDRATSGINKVRVALKTVGKLVTRPIVQLKDGASSVLKKVWGTLKTVGKTVAKPFVALKDGASKILSTVSGTLKKIGSTIAKPFVTVKDGASSVLSKISGTLGKLAKGATIAVGVAGAGVSALVGGSLSEGAKLQQSTGGVETLFKGDAGAVIENANKAYQTAGISANTYMEQVTSFSASLLNSLGGDTKKASEVANTAIIDMADNANKFGTNIGDIQNAYQGFAKQNYTMLDNLKLGYGGTKTEMQRLLKDAQKISGQKYDISNLSDVYNAIHVIQENLDVTGTTAKEASTTFSGAFSSMKASAQNFLGALSTGGDVKGTMSQLVESASTFLFNNAIPMIVNVFKSLPDAISTGLASASPKIQEGLRNLLPESVMSGLSSAVGTFRGIFETAMPVVQGIIDNVCIFITGIMPTVSSVFSTVGGIIQQVLTVIGNHMGLFQTIVSTVVTVVTTVWNTLAPIISASVDLIITIVDSLLTGIEAVFNYLAPYISTIWTSICGFFSSASATITTVVNTLKSIFQSLYSKVSSVFSAISSAVSSSIGKVVSVISGAIDKISAFVDKVGGAISKAKEFVNSGVGKVKGALGFAYGKDRVPYDNYPAILHQGEKVLTRNQADQYERKVSTRGVQLTQNIAEVPRDDSNVTSNTGNTGTTQEIPQAKTGATTFNIEKLAETVVIEKDADVDKVVEDMINKFKKLVPNMA